MSNYRQIHTKIWKDEFFGELSAEDKLLFIYLFSNELASLSGLYKLSLRVIEFETGLNQAVIQSALGRFAQAGKVYYENGVIWVKNLQRYNANTSPKVRERIKQDLADIPDCPLKRAYMDGTIPQTSAPIPYPESKIPYSESKSDQYQEQEQEQSRTVAGAEDITAPKGGADEPLPFADADSLKDDDDAQAFVEQQLRKQEAAPKEKAKKPANPTFLLAVALAEVCQQDFSANQGRLLKEAGQLARAAPPATPEVLKEHYNGPGCWWYTSHWRGHDKHQAPTPPAIRETWGQWQGGGKGNGHGNGGNAAESVAMRSIREYVESG